MAIKPSVEPFDKVTKRAKDKLKQRAGVTHWASDSVARSLLDATTAEHRLVAERTKKAVESIQIGSAKGGALDALGEARGVTRLPARFASTETTDMNFQFYVATGTFGDINSGSDIVIPAGTIVTAGEALEPARNISSEQRVTYKTKGKYILPAGSSSMYCGVEAVTPGSAMNVAENVLLRHSFEGYTNSNSRSLLCRNRRSILNGRNVEDDESLRFRIANHYTALASSNETAIAMRALTVPGVRRVATVPNYYGIGTAAVFVFGIDKESNRNMVSAVQEKISELQTAGLRIHAMPGVEVKFDFVMTIHVREGIGIPQQELIRREVAQLMNSYFSANTDTITSRVSLRAIHDLITSSGRIRSVITGKGTAEEMFDNVYIRKGYSASNQTSERLTLDSMSYTVDKHEYAKLGTLEIRFQRTDLAI